MEEQKHICAECTHWDNGDTWDSGNGHDHGVVVECQGWCMWKKDKNGDTVKRKRWNYHKVCSEFTRKPCKGLFYLGCGEPTEEDLNNITRMLENLVTD